MGVTVTWVPGKIFYCRCISVDASSVKTIKGQKENGFNKDRRGNSALIAIVSETFRRVQLLILL
ncbi:MAG: hypothetical protein ACRD72_20045, partial [Candidatus Angelobacter sp.]